jgi:hypothetical protein
MATQTRQITRRSARFFRATVTAYIGTACCGLVLWSAVGAHAARSANGMPFNGLYVNGLAPNATTLQREPLPAVPQESLPFNGLSQRALGKAAVLSGSDGYPPLPVELPDVR